MTGAKLKCILLISICLSIHPLSALGSDDGQFLMADFAEEDGPSADEFLCFSFSLKKQITMTQVVGEDGKRVTLFNRGHNKEDNSEVIASAEPEDSLGDDTHHVKSLDNPITLVPWKAYTLCSDSSPTKMKKHFYHPKNHPIMHSVSEAFSCCDGDTPEHPQDLLSAEANEFEDQGKTYPLIGFKFETEIEDKPDVETAGVSSFPTHPIIFGALRNGKGADVVTIFEFTDDDVDDDYDVKHACEAGSASEVSVPTVFDDIGQSFATIDNGGCDPFDDGADTRWGRFVAITEKGKSSGDWMRIPADNHGGSAFQVSDYTVGEENSHVPTICYRFTPTTDINVESLIVSGKGDYIHAYIVKDVNGSANTSTVADIDKVSATNGVLEKKVEINGPPAKLHGQQKYWLCQAIEGTGIEHLGASEIATGGTSLVDLAPIIEEFDSARGQDDARTADDVEGLAPWDDLDNQNIDAFPKIGFTYSNSGTKPSIKSQSFSVAESEDEEIVFRFSSSEEEAVAVAEWVHADEDGNTKLQKRFVTELDDKNVQFDFNLEQDSPLHIRGSLINEAGVSSSEGEFERVFTGNPFRAESFSLNHPDLSSATANVRGVFFEPGENIRINGLIASALASIGSVELALYEATLEDGNVQLVGDPIFQVGGDDRRVFFRHQYTLTQGKGYTLVQKVNGEHLISSNVDTRKVERLLNVKINRWGPAVTTSGDIDDLDDITISDDFPNIGVLLSSFENSDPITEEGLYVSNFADVIGEKDDTFFERGYAFKVDEYVHVTGLAGGGTLGNFTGHLYKLNECSPNGKVLETNETLCHVEFEGTTRRQVRDCGGTVLLEPETCYMFTQGSKFSDRDSADSAGEHGDHYRIYNLDGDRLLNMTRITFWNADEDDEQDRFGFSWWRQSFDDTFNNRDFEVLPDIGLVTPALEINHITTFQNDREYDAQEVQVGGFIQSRGMLSYSVNFEHSEDGTTWSVVPATRTEEDDGHEYSAVLPRSSDDFQFRIVFVPFVEIVSKITGERRKPIYMEPFFPLPENDEQLTIETLRARIKDDFFAKSDVRFIVDRHDGDPDDDTRGYNRDGQDDELMFKGDIDTTLAGSLESFKINVSAENENSYDFTKEFSSVSLGQKFALTVQSGITQDRGSVLRGLLFSTRQETTEENVFFDYGSDTEALTNRQVVDQASVNQTTSPAQPDGFEPNDDFDQASPVYVLDEKLQLSFHSTEDVDVFVVDVREGDGVKVQVRLDQKDAVGLHLFDWSREEIASEDQSNSLSEDELEEGLYYVVVTTDKKLSYELMISVGPNADDANISNKDRTLSVAGMYEIELPGTTFFDDVSYRMGINKSNSEFVDDNEIHDEEVLTLWKLETRVVEADDGEDVKIKGVSFQDDDRYWVAFEPYEDGECTQNRLKDKLDNEKDTFKIYDTVRAEDEQLEYESLHAFALNSSRIAVTRFTDRGVIIVNADCAPVLHTVKTTKTSFDKDGYVTLLAVVESTNNDKLSIHFEYGDSANNLNETIAAQSAGNGVYESESTLDVPFSPVYYKVVVEKEETQLPGPNDSPRDRFEGNVKRAISGITTAITSFDENGQALLRGVVGDNVSDVNYIRFAYGSDSNDLNGTVDAVRSDGENEFESEIPISRSDVNPLYYRIEVVANQNKHDEEDKVLTGEPLRVLSLHTLASKYDDVEGTKATLKAEVEGFSDTVFDSKNLKIFFEVGDSFEKEVEDLENVQDDYFSKSTDVGEEASVNFRVAAKMDGFEERGPGREVIRMKTFLSAREKGGSTNMTGSITDGVDLKGYKLQFMMLFEGGSMTTKSYIHDHVDNGERFLQTVFDEGFPVQCWVQLEGGSAFDTLNANAVPIWELKNQTSMVRRDAELDFSFEISAADGSGGIDNPVSLTVINNAGGLVSSGTTTKENDIKHNISLPVSGTPGRRLFFNVIIGGMIPSEPDFVYVPWTVLATEGITRIAALQLDEQRKNADVTFKGTISDFVEGNADISKVFEHGSSRDSMPYEAQADPDNDDDRIDISGQISNHYFLDELYYRIRLTEDRLDNENTNTGWTNVWPVIGDFEEGEEFTVPDDYEQEFGI